MIVAPHFLYAATLSFSPSSGSFTMGSNFTVRVIVNPEGDEPLNAVEAVLGFDTTHLRVTNVTKEGSVFSLWTTEPTFSNNAGTIEFGGGSPTPFSDTNTLINITFQARQEGSADVVYNSGSVLAADGRGTDVLSGTTKGSYTITKSKATPPVQIPTGPKPPAPIVTSETHPDEETWYSESNVIYNWDLPFDAIAVRLLLDNKPLTRPSVVYSPPLIEREIRGLGDDIWYFHAQFQNTNGWGDITHYRTLIDVTPPDEFTIEIISGESTTTLPKLAFETVDETSGLQHYEILFGDEEPVILTPLELKALPEGLWEVLPIIDGTYAVLIRAIDLAGNSTEAEASIVIQAGIAPPEKPVQAQVEEEKGINFLLIIILLLLLIILLLIAFLIWQRRRIDQEHDLLRRETKEIRDRMEKIFSVLQDELEEQIRNLDKKPRLSKSEKEVLDNLREALEVSEAFINKEIEDVEKILQ